MTKIYIYCLFDDARGEALKGVYSSIKAVHRDALRLANRGDSRVYMVYENKAVEATAGKYKLESWVSRHRRFFATTMREGD